MSSLTRRPSTPLRHPRTTSLPPEGKSKLTDEEYDGIPTPSTGTPPVVGNKSKVARKQASSGVKIPATKRFANFNSRLNKLAEAKKADGKRFNKLVKKLQSHKTYAEKIVSSVVMALAALSTSFSQMSKQMQDVKESVSDLKFFKKVVEEEDYEMRVKKAEFSFCRLEAYMSAATGVLYDLSQGRFDLNELAGYVNYGVEEGEPEVVQPEDGNRVRSQPTMEDISGGDDDDGHLEFINVDGDVDEVVETVDVVEEVLPATPPLNLLRVTRK
ncbi:hypothetical protein BC829DRAFT_16437 [Chytridium lagenaria]|nr:hypothetical protein BC829DRAFT_16437 [Chytridium lagenaria]